MSIAPAASSGRVVRPSWFRLLAGTLQYARNGELTLGVAIIVIWAALIAAAPLIAKYDPLNQQIEERLQPP